MPHAPVDPTSLWWQRIDVPPAAPPLREPTTADVVVVGAGITGATVARDLARAGLDVVVLEAGRAAAGATGHSSAKLTALQSPRYARLEDEHGAEAAAAYAAASLAAVERVADLVAELDAPADLQRATALTWTDEQDQVELLHAELEAARRAGLAVDPASAGDHGLPVLSGVELPDQAQFDPVPYVHALVDDAVAAGARVFEQTPVQAVSLTGTPRRVTTDLASVTCGHVVVATGLPILDRGGWFARTEPQRSYVVAMEVDRTPPSMALRVGSATRSTRGTATADGQPVVLVTGSEHRTGRGGDTRRRYEALATWGRRVLDAGAVVGRWSAQDWSSVDGLPLVGPLVGRDDRVLAAAGFDKWGLTSGTAAAAVLVDAVLARPRSLIAEVLSPGRLARSTAPGLVRTNAVVGWSMTSGWLHAVTSGEPAQLGTGHGVVHRDGARVTATSRTVDGVRSCSAVCPHLGGIVAWEPGDQAWGCPLHGSRFAPDGRVLSGPATESLAPRPTTSGPDRAGSRR